MANSKDTAPQQPGIVYVMGPFGNLVKIGYTASPETRLRAICRTLKMARQPPVKYLAQKQGNRCLEALYHRHFKDRQVDGEWFSDNGTLVHEFNNAYSDLLSRALSVSKKRLSLEDRSDRIVVLEMMDRIKEAGSLRKLANQIGFSATYLSQVMLGDRETSEKLADALGYERVIEYRLSTNQRMSTI